MTAITQIGEPVLRQRAKKVRNFRDPWVAAFVERLKREMAVADGAGLAAPQLGVGRRVFVARIDDVVEHFVNPEVAERSRDTLSYVEGCLSIGGAYTFVVSRAVWVELRWQDAQGRRHRRRFNGWNARLVQHEFDHLEGKLVADVGSVHELIARP